MKQFFIALCMLASMSAYAQGEYDISKDDVTGATIFKGKCTADDLNKEASFDWYRKGIKSYKPNKMKLLVLNQYLRHYDLLVFMGTWCDDSHNIIPKLMKVMKETDYPSEQFTLYGVDRAKTTKGNIQEQYKITMVPTIIVLKNDKEVGRITETLKESVEADLADIVQRDVAMSN